ncbi:MAG: FAD-dependent monooxygenase [Myxococcota bacterium]|nr:FAD-dependent monooxygenase [Myxococcota bacterium]
MKTEHAVVIAGAGPTGLMLAAELMLAKVDVALVERRENQELIGSRALGLHARTLEVFDQRGIAERFLAEGQPAQVAGFSGVAFDISDFPSRHPHGLALVQRHIERILAGWVAELKVPFYRQREVQGFAQDDDGVVVAVSDGSSLRAQYLVGCDGGRSIVRKTAGIEFPGADPTLSWLIAEVELAQEPPQWGLRRDHLGIRALSKREDGRIGVLVTEQRLVTSAEPTLGELGEAMKAVYGSDYGVHSPTSISRFTDVARQAATYRAGRVLLAGDAAHIHPPIGGQGLNIGVQDAVNLGWKLAQVVKGSSSPTLLDTYHSERHPIAARVLRNTMAATVLQRVDDRIKALGEVIDELLRMEEPRKRFAAMMSGFDVHYDLGAGHPQLGRRMPDLDLVTGDGPVRVFTLLHQARPLLLNFGKPGSTQVAAWAAHVRLVDAQISGRWLLPVFGEVSAPDAVLIRPDGYVAWVGEGSQNGLPEALSRWFGMGSQRSDPGPAP